MLVESNMIKGTLAIVIASFLWSTTGTIASFSSDVSPLAIGAFAMGFGGILMVLTNIRSLLANYRQLTNERGYLLLALYQLQYIPGILFRYSLIWRCDRYYCVNSHCAHVCRPS